MSYQVLARKWRPHSFAELVGQTHVLQALVNALDQGRLHHAYLFTGTRGVGKTTVARIFAKCLNCEEGVSSTPCGQCAACSEINEGRFVDLIEVDAASRTKVEDIRELLDNVQYAPTRGRYKVYLIDEVHMLSTHSFNALLKTLEEPPPHIKFLLATTDPQKLPVTILSRCLQFSLKNMVPERIVEHLKIILGHEQVVYEVPALWQLALSANGSMRDALSLTDQAIAFSNGRISESDVSAMLGTMDRGQVMRIMQALATANVENVIEAVAELSDFSPDYASVLDDILSFLHRIALAQAVPNAVDNSLGDREQVLKLAANMGAEDVQLYYQVGLIGKKDLPLAPDPRGGFEMAMLRMMAFRPELSPIIDSGRHNTRRESSGSHGQSSAILPSDDPEPEGEPCSPTVVETSVTEGENKASKLSCSDSQPVVKGDDDEVVDSHESVDEQESICAPQEQSVPKSENLARESPAVVSDSQVDVEEQIPLSALDAASWITIFYNLPIGGVTGNIASHCQYLSHDQYRVNMVLDSDWSALYNDMHRERIEVVLSKYFAEPLKLHIDIGTIQTETPADWRQRQIDQHLQEAQQSIYNDPVVKMLINTFFGTVLEETIEPVGRLIE